MVVQEKTETYLQVQYADCIPQLHTLHVYPSYPIVYAKMCVYNISGEFFPKGCIKSHCITSNQYIP